MNAATPDQRRELAEFFGRVMRRAVEVGANLTDQMDPAARSESLRAELRERIDGPDIEETILTRPLEEIIREIRRDLGLVLREGHRIGLRRTPEDLALLRDIAACPPTQTPTPEPTLPRVDRLARRNQTAEPEPETRADPERHQGQSLLEYLMRER